MTTTRMQLADAITDMALRYGGSCREAAFALAAQPSTVKRHMRAARACDRQLRCIQRLTAALLAATS